MNKREKEVIAAQLEDEEKVISQLERHYRLALDDVELVIRLLQSDEQTQSKIHRINYQKKLKAQLEAILEKMRMGEYKTLQQYLTGCYTSGYVGTMYDLHGQGVPVIAPVNQDAAAKAIQLDTQLSTRKAYKSANGEMVALYESLGIDTDRLKSTIRSEITRGIASGMTYDMMARNIASMSKAPLSRAKTIARTEGHRILQQSAEDARVDAKNHGADLVRQWDATLDGSTRSAHRELDGQTVEMDEYFHYGTKKAKYPGGFGDPKLDCNCRCVALSRPRSALDAKELEVLKERAEFFKLDKTESFRDFEKKYLKAAETIENPGKSGIIKTDKQFGKKIGKHAMDYGLDPGNHKDREKMRVIIDDICLNADEVAKGEWRGQSEPVKFYIKGEDVVVTNENDVFITILKGGASNARVKNARRK